MRDLAGHAPDHAGFLVLRDDVAAGGDQRLAAGKPVGAHAGQHQAERLAAPHRGGGGEHRVDRRLAEIHHRAVVERDHRGAVVAARDRHVAAAGGDVDGAGIDRLALPALVHRALGDARQVLGQDGGEGRRHVLGDQHRRALDDAGRAAPSTALSACGPPVEAPISSTRGGVSGIGRSASGGCSGFRLGCSGGAATSRRAGACRRRLAQAAARASPDGGSSRSARAGRRASR